MNLYKFAAYTRPTPTSTQNHTRVTNVAAHGSNLNDAETRALELLGTAPGKREWVLQFKGVEDTLRPLPDREQIARAIFDVHNRLGRSDYNGLPRETSLDAADAVIALLKGEPT